MTYRVTFMERTGASAEPSEKPQNYLEIQVPEGVVLDKAMVQRDEPLATHNDDGLTEDDDFLSIGSETWDYEIAAGREDEFLAAAKNSEMVLECVAVHDEAEP